MSFPPNEVQGFCPSCRRDTTLQVFALSTMDFLHGNYEQICRACILTRLIANAQRLASNLPAWEAELAALKAAGLAALVLCLLPALAGAQIATDRPTFTHTPRVIAPGAVQVEAGLTREPDVVTAPQALVRVGLVDRLEVRLVLPGVTRASGDASMADAGGGLEVQVLRGAVDVAVFAGVTGHPGTGPTSFVRGMLNRQLMASTMVGALLGVTRTDRARAEGSAMLAQTLSGPWSAYVEGIRTRDTFANVGLLRTFGPRFQLDAWAGRNVTAHAWSGGVGVAVLRGGQ